MKKKINSFISPLFLNFLFFLSFHFASAQINQQKLSDTTIVQNEENESKFNEEDEQLLRKKYFGNMHRTAPGVDWRKIEAANAFRSYQQLSAQKITPGNYANGNLNGDWYERGSNNQAGRVDLAEYDSATNKLYVVNDVGVLFRGVPDSANWHPMNDQLRFTSGGIKVVPNGSARRLIITAGLNTFYTDNDGASYKASSGFVFPVEWGGNNTEQIVATGDTKHTLYCLVLEWDDTLWQPLYYLYRSTNKGANWTRVYKFSEGNEQEVVLWSPPGKNFVYALENVDGASTTIYKIQGTTVTSLNSAPAISNNSPLQFKGILENNKTKLFALLQSGEFYTSSNLGKKWNYVNTNSEITPVFSVSLIDSNAVEIGGVPNCFRSNDGGQTLNLVNDWTEYYGNVANKLHADERNLYFFKRSNGSEFAIVLCDGGVYRSDDYLHTVHNISLKGLNVGEFYDVRTDPTNASWLFGGSQDQGFQRTSNLSTQGVVDFTQVISGDYGHLQLTRNYQTLWIEYVGGRADYYFNSHGKSSNNSYYVPGSFLPEFGWLLPTAQVYPASKNQIFIAGGNINGGDGSYLIKLTGTSSSPFNITATQFNYDFKSHADGVSGISAIGTTPINANKLYVATEDGEFFYSSNGGTSWNKQSFTAPYPYCNCGYGSTIYASKLTANLVYYGGSGYSKPAVNKSTDGGVTSSPMVNGLPSTLVYDLIANPDESLLFAATEAGPYVYVVADTTWYPFSGGIAPLNVAYTSVDYDVLTNTVRFSTYGRGIWDFKISAQPSIALFKNNR